MSEKNKSYQVPFPCSVAGSNIVPVFERVFDEETKKSPVKQVRTFDVYEFIQASNNLTDLAMLRQQMIATGEIPHVDDDLVYGADFSGMPENIHEMYDVVNRLLVIITNNLLFISTIN